MLKNIAIFFLSFLALPFAAVVSAVFIAFVLAVFALVSPFAVLGGALYAAGKISEKIIDLIYTNENDFQYIQSNSQAISSTLLQAAFTLLAYIPSALVIALTTVFLTPLMFIAFTAVSSYLASEFVVNKIASFFEPEYINYGDEIMPLSIPDAANFASLNENSSTSLKSLLINEVSNSESDSCEENLSDTETKTLGLL
jgi:hypothetical protein